MAQNTVSFSFDRSQSGDATRNSIFPMARRNNATASADELPRPMPPARRLSSRSKGALPRRRRFCSCFAVTSALGTALRPKGNGRRGFVKGNGTASDCGSAARAGRLARFARIVSLAAVASHPRLKQRSSIERFGAARTESLSFRRLIPSTIGVGIFHGRSTNVRASSSERASGTCSREIISAHCSSRGD